MKELSLCSMMSTMDALGYVGGVLVGIMLGLVLGFWEASRAYRHGKAALMVGKAALAQEKDAWEAVLQQYKGRMQDFDTRLAMLAASQQEQRDELNVVRTLALM